MHTFILDRGLTVSQIIYYTSRADGSKNVLLTSFGDWNWCCNLIDVEEPISEPWFMTAT